MKKYILTLILGLFTFISVGQTVIYTQGFETTNDWTISTTINNNNNYWVWGLGTAGATTGSCTHTGVASLQIWERRNNNWYANYYNWYANYYNWGTGGSTKTAAKTFNLSSIPMGSNVYFSYWVICKGEVNYDDLRVTINGSVYDGPLNNINNWQQRTINLTSFVGNSSVIVRFEWRNDGSVLGNPGARIDDISLYTDVNLPIELLSFDGSKKDDYNLLKWTTASENNNDYFTIERSEDGENWKIIDIVDGTGNSTSNINYSLIDDSHKNVINYYRLKQTDYDGKFELFEKIVGIDNRLSNKKVIKTTNLLGQDIDENYKGMVIDVYEDNTTSKRLQ